ncbi:D-alanyl-lipoteichoic acid acyltransferase DltB (MBOAT superfamily) [Mariniflexile fucanivorans]|uniref:D-alanyl-lipoteichoic acid acyltransferase DltB (MBOAT superfamily) n=1 Tax=Mariniflexile fucanivorans TaxID=264023 RepID=A0A4V6NGV2_9FLAO|nr:MBOAT family O-acyltransferase [Mariniflexile fucanivorans]TCL64857.1 D-alanyl-lipoteichoic acid acyltransferase DltB (MBOAT superfamily) [Mariniflexile fucanivorans]
MIFNSYDFVVFFVVVFILYWFVFNKTAKAQNVLLLISSLFFYAWADWRFLGILIFNILFNYYLAKSIFKASKVAVKQKILWFGILINVGILGYYKYFNFFYENLINIFSSGTTFTALDLLIPLGISFFTFQSLGYIIDVYYEEVEPYNDLMLFSTYMVFFPKLLSGPIERVQKFIPQIVSKRVFDYPLIADGLRQILWGLFAKLVIAENCAVIVDPVFENYNNESGSTLLFVSFFYMIQLYADFSGYSNMAIGVAKLLGIKLSRNFATPFFSLNISEFWRKWHMTLTSWMMDYIFTPLSFILRAYKKIGLIISVIITFLIVGLWHGANWTYIVFGLIHGIYFIPVILKGTSVNKASNTMTENKYLPSVVELFKMLVLLVQVMLASVFFRSETVIKAINYLSRIFSKSLISLPSSIINGRNALIFMFIAFFITVEWFHKTKSHEFDISGKPLYIRWFFYIIIFILLLFAGRTAEAFIYFQF